jgi:hypothetical protein
VNPGGEPERDDTGLPPVDIEVPDDARELDRDVQAYRRELRAVRRSERQGRWHRSLSKDGVLLPLLACCLILALITGTLLTVFTATSDRSLTGPGGSATSAPARAGPRVVRNTVLPDSTIAVDGRGPVPVAQIKNAVLVLVPPGCRCVATVNWLAGVASGTKSRVYVIYTQDARAAIRQFRSQVSGSVLLAEDTGNALSAAKLRVGIPASQLAAILVAPDSVATWASQLNPVDNKAPLIQALTG